MREGISNNDAQKIIEKAEFSQIKVKFVTEMTLRDINDTNQGIVAFVDEAPELDWQSLKSEEPAIYVCLDEIQDPHNLGAILRTSWLIGVKGVFVSAHKSNLLTPSACKVACGGAEHVPVDAHTNLPNLLKELKKMNFWIYGLDMGGDHDLWSPKLTIPEKIVWVIGNEGKGLRKPIKNICDEIVHIKQTVSSASFNASVATAMALSETARRNLQVNTD